MSIENGPSQEPEQNKEKLSLDDFRDAVRTHLEGTRIYALMLAANYQTDSEGNLESHVLENIKTLIRKGDQMSPDETVKWKFRQMLDFLNKY